MINSYELMGFFSGVVIGTVGGYYAAKKIYDIKRFDEVLRTATENRIPNEQEVRRNCLRGLIKKLGAGLK